MGLGEFDYIDIGAILDTSGAVPVVIKSLIFPFTAALGKAGKAGKQVVSGTSVRVDRLVDSPKAEAGPSIAT